MATAYFNLFLLSAFVAFSCGNPASDNVKRKEVRMGPESIELQPTELPFNTKNSDLPYNLWMAYGIRELGDILIHSYIVGPIEITNDPDPFRADVDYLLPTNYEWTRVEVFIGQLEGIESSFTVYWPNYRKRLSLTYRSLCNCSVVRYEVILYAKKLV